MTKTNFFTELSLIGLKHVLLEIRLADNGSMTIFVIPKSEEISKSNTMREAFKIIMPFTLTAFPDDLDDNFFDTVSEPLAETGKVISNMESYRANLEEANKMAAEKSKPKVANTDKAKEAITEAKPSKEELANIAKMAKAEGNVREQYELCTGYTTFGKNKAKLKKMLDALKLVMETTKLESKMYEPVLEFFEANNAIMDGSFIAPKIGFDHVTKELQESIDNTEIKVTEEKSAETAGPVPPVVEVTETSEAEAEEQMEETETVEDEDGPGQSLAAMNAERTKERKSQLRSLGLNESELGFTGCGFNIQQSTIQNHNAEYWAELIKGIQDVVNKDNIGNLEPVQGPGPSGTATKMNVVDTMAETQTASEKRFDQRKAKLISMGMEIVGIEFKRGKFIVSSELVNTNDDNWFSNVVEHFTKEFELWEQCTKNRIIELLSYGYTETGNGKYMLDNDRSVSINDIESQSDVNWKSAMDIIKEFIVKKSQIIPLAPVNGETVMVFVLNADAPHSYDDYKNAGWNDQQLVQQGLGSFVAQQATEQTAIAPSAPLPPASLLGSEDESLIS